MLPAKFIPLAEEIGLIQPLGEWLLHSACVQTKTWQQEGYPPIRLSVNVSMNQFKQNTFIKTLLQILKEVNLDPHFIELELTESR